MRGVWISCVLFLLVLTGMIVSQYALEKHSIKMLDMLTEVTDAVKEEDWTKALRKTEETQQSWDDAIKWVAMLVHHDETDEILKTIYAMKEYIRYREVPELMATAATLKGLFEHIPAKERPVIENIF